MSPEPREFSLAAPEIVGLKTIHRRNLNGW
jgi:hypothetical protein